MALPLSHLQPPLISSFHHHTHNKTITTISLRFAPKTKPQFKISLSQSNNNNRRFNRIYPPKSASVNGFPAQTESPEDKHNVEFPERVRRWIVFIRSILPGGNWWRFPEPVDVELTAKPVTVLRALQRMWELIANDRWVVFAAFAALVLTALSEISIPHFLTASIFSAQSGEITVFHRNVRLLIILCLTGGICSGVRGCCFGIANMIIVKRMRETLYSSLLYQDISFFDNETVGDLTSRLGADCQQVSRVIGNDLNSISRNVLQGTGAMIYLLILSWPLGLCTLAICSTLSAIMLSYGQYQKKAAKLVQEFTASANEVLLED